jgi:hypothetical protein
METYVDMASPGESGKLQIRRNPAKTADVNSLPGVSPKTDVVRL